jgi:hypothetical protein
MRRVAVFVHLFAFCLFHAALTLFVPAPLFGSPSFEVIKQLQDYCFLPLHFATIT